MPRDLCSADEMYLEELTEWGEQRQAELEEKEEEPIRFADDYR